MNRIKNVVIGLFLSFVITQFFIFQGKADESVLVSGFLEKTYTVKQDALDKALDSIFAKTIASSTTILEDKNGIIRNYGVGDKNGKFDRKFSSWGGVSTIKELDIKEGGVTIAVKTITGESGVIVGFKVGDGNKTSSKLLHELLANKLQRGGEVDYN